MRAALGLVALVGVALLMRSTALSVVASKGVIIDVLAFVTLIWALKYGESWGATFGFVLGLAADIDAAHWLGRHALLLSLLGYASGRLARTLVRDSARTQLVLILVATVAHQAWSLAFEFGGAPSWRYVQLVLLAGVATAPLGATLLAVMRHGSGQPLFGHAALEPGPKS